MRLRFWIRMMLTLAAGAAGLWVGCTEKEPVEVDETPPLVRYVRPDAGTGLNISPTAVTDSITLVAFADDASGIDRVEFWCTFHGDSVSRNLGEDRTADPGGVYSLFWDSRGMANGTTGALWAVAYDKPGNQGRTREKISILVINSQLIAPPIANFTITPNSGGTVATSFRFDPTLTYDAIDRLDRVRVRWDFNYDPAATPTWDIDTTNARADDIQFHTFAQPGTYTIALQAFNTYYPRPSEIATRELTVRPEFGEPRDPAPYVLVPAGTYPIGVIRKADGQNGLYNTNEMVRDTLFVTLTANIYIDEFEVTNRLYVNFLDSLFFEGEVSYNSGTWDVTDAATQGVLITLDPELTRIIYVDEEEGFTVEHRARNAPVTGVTWHGARTYCSTYGLRLPSEYEWEIAARLGRLSTSLDGEYIYPWTPYNQINGNYANYRDSGDPYEERNNLRAESPVGTYSDIDSLMGEFPHENAIGPTGTYDQAGNVAEWVNDWYVSDIYNTLRGQYEQSRRWPADPQSPREDQSETRTRVTRGGSFYSSPSFVRVTYREARDPDVGYPTVGFRAVFTEFNP